MDKKVTIGGIDFPIIIAASGAMGNFGEGYWYSKLEKEWSILNTDGLGFVSKTATEKINKGFTPFIYDGKFFPPAELKPSSIKVNLLSENILNAVGLSNPGLKAFLETGNWQKRKDNFWISIMSIAKTKEARLKEMQNMIQLLKEEKSNFEGDFGLQINLSCPNTGHDNSELSLEANELIDIASELKVPIMAKFSIASSTIENLIELEKNENLDAICLSNTIPYDWVPNPYFYGEELCKKWKKPFGEKSPLEKYGGGGISGKMIKPFVLKFIEKLKLAGFEKHINGGGGISSPKDIVLYKNAGADSFFIGSIIITRPLRVSKIIEEANKVNA